MARARDHAGADDLPVLLDFASRSLTARFPLDAGWHPGDLAWELKDTQGKPQDIRLWEAADGVVAVAWEIEPGDLWFEALPTHDHLIDEALDWASAELCKSGRLRVRSLEGDVRRAEALEARGYRLTTPESVRLRLDLNGEMQAPPLPPGMALRDCVGIDPEARAASHRDAWSHLAHIGLPKARSSFSAETYQRLVALPGYDPSLDILVEAPGGRLAGGSLCWADPVSGMGTFEPVGTHVDFRGLGLARAATLEGLRRLKARGLRHARVSTAHFNAPAIATYRSAGFEVIDRMAWWERSPL
ncbi:MAG: GNAT family N-acetyltransferase [Phenylobacterium sp.]|uniref:GNAT family N-acetyltransferase n=1 Tax=Phenylobacterium sp. TaxID=1871053 RepID=UPI001B65727D|nr:GNAT family N-acetyltransferase [Phenylobacterium sp.]MBP7649606.1 GNAT family N-acetyltransferase [Phenylobacterium sp.]MBP7815557.1 GNAT family N-acetyltransferase [Phenylobacterium sp.]MBP9231184.1 GNAT family N-acetyltransferase [Phenylobacterium sp.]MBP9753622.1 GNAT family N-acetyltransferase [Phenylobacterium sp.]